MTMHFSKYIAEQIEKTFFGGNWTGVCLFDVLNQVSFTQANTQIHQLNTISKLVFHINYYTDAVLEVLYGGDLVAQDQYSFQCPEIKSPEDWQALTNQLFSNAKQLTIVTKQLTDDQLQASFAQEKFGTYFTNLCGLVEHTHYHLGQIVILKKLMK